MNAFTDQDMDLDPVDVARRHAAGELVLVDVREPYAWEAGHVPGSSHVQMERSGLVAQGFRAVGYDAYNVRGGFALWCALELPVEPEGATAAPH